MLYALMVVAGVAGCGLGSTPTPFAPCTCGAPADPGRLAAVRELGWERAPVTILDPADVLRAEADENVVRKDFTPSEAVAIFEAMKPLVATPKHVSAASRDGESFPISGRTRDKVAAYVGMSGRTLEKAIAVAEARAGWGVVMPIA